MPQAFHHAGYLVGTIGTIVIGSIAVYCIQMILVAHYELCKRKKVPSMDYPTIAQTALLEGFILLIYYNNYYYYLFILFIYSRRSGMDS